MSSKQYHDGTLEYLRKREGERIAGAFTDKEKRDRESYPHIPSPRGENWRTYIVHRMKMFVDGMNTYAQRRYKRLDFEKYVESNRRMEEIAKFLTKNQPSLVLAGGSDMHPGAPIGVKKTYRPPSTKKLENSIKKLGHSDVLRVPEPFTSQTCPNCFERFPRSTRSHRFKECVKCARNAQMKIPERDEGNKIIKLYKLPPMIATMKSNRRKKLDRAVKSDIDSGKLNPAAIEDEEFQPRRLESKKMYFEKKWPLTRLDEIPNAPVDLDMDVWIKFLYEIDVETSELPFDEETADSYFEIYKECRDQLKNLSVENFKIIWHRDIAAARCILYVGG